MVRQINPVSVLDGFSGTTRVSQALAQSGYTVVANDLSAWSEVFGKCYLLNTRPSSYYRPIIEHLNALPGKDGWFTEHYGGDPNSSCSIGIDGLKNPWQIHNTRRLDAIREEIDLLSASEIERAVLLTSLILALDRVESTLGHFASYLNDWSPRSYNRLELRVPNLVYRDTPTLSIEGIFLTCFHKSKWIWLTLTRLMGQIMTKCHRLGFGTALIITFGLLFAAMIDLNFSGK